LIWFHVSYTRYYWTSCSDFVEHQFFFCFPFLLHSMCVSFLWFNHFFYTSIAWYSSFVRFYFSSCSLFYHILIFFEKTLVARILCWIGEYVTVMSHTSTIIYHFFFYSSSVFCLCVFSSLYISVCISCSLIRSWKE